MGFEDNVTLDQQHCKLRKDKIMTYLEKKTRAMIPNHKNKANLFNMTN